VTEIADAKTQFDEMVNNFSPLDVDKVRATALS
jgi:hypothetical protein